MIEKDIQVELLKLARGWINFPDGKICKHLVVADLLSMMESKGFPLSSALAKHVVNAEDDCARRMFTQKIIQLESELK